MRKDILSYNDVKDVAYGNNNEPLVKANNYSLQILCEYKKFDMFPWTGFDILVRDSVARKLAEANAILQERYGFNLKVVYGYRSIDIQSKYFNKRFAELKLERPTLNDDALRWLTHNYVAVPDTAGHTLGAAIDLTLVDENGECDMGTPIADYTDPIAIQTFAKTTPSQARLRRILLKVMMDVGFAPFLGEWWHFSYGDKEWAAYYGREKALYAPIETEKGARTFHIANGNKTALQIADAWKGELSNRQASEALMSTFNDIDQAGIYYKDINKLEMAGGEFCGNASAATAALLSGVFTEPEYKVSGLNGLVSAHVEKLLPKKWRVTATFSTLSYQVAQTVLENTPIAMVSFEGITHILLEGSLPRTYLVDAEEIRTKAQLKSCDAVGVIWYRRNKNNNEVSIDPIVWVREINSQFYETSCGSGSMAAAIALGANTIVQPSGDSISVRIVDKTIETTSIVEECS